MKGIRLFGRQIIDYSGRATVSRRFVRNDNIISKTKNDRRPSSRATAAAQSADGHSPLRTLNDGQKDDDDEEEESDVEHYPVNLVVVAVGRFDLVSDTTAGSHAFVQMEHETLKHGRAENRGQCDGPSGDASGPLGQHLPSTCRDTFCPPRRPPLGRRISGRS